MIISHLGKKGLFHLTVEVYHPGTSGQELMHRPWRNTAHWLTPYDLVCLFYTIPEPLAQQCYHLNGLCHSIKAI